MFRLLIKQSAHLRYSVVTRRPLSLQEYQAKELLQSNGCAVQKFFVVDSNSTADRQFEKYDYKEYAVKAQILAGGRGKGRFVDGPKDLSGVHITSDKSRAKDAATKMLNRRLVTKQTPKDGVMVSKIMIADSVQIQHEKYLAILLDRQFNGPVLIGSSKGGMDIEEVAATDPAAIITIPVDINVGVDLKLAKELSEKMGFKSKSKDQAADNIVKLYKLFIQSDCSMLEINPLVEDVDGNVVCMDSKVNLDQNAEFRQKSLFALKDNEQLDELEVRAEQAHLNYIRLDGNIGCLVNGAGLAMATMDIVKLHGGEPANFLDVGGGATVEQKRAKSNVFFINIFGGIMRCDVIAKGIIQAASESNSKIPIVARLHGTRVDEAKEMIRNSKLHISTCDSLDEAAEMVVKLAEGRDVQKN
ncbi:Succinate--CoA ligase [ADP-forming] subunit beta, mitochondrial [Aphelenchoides besseyi]|nr:Succinate--CoA ligase [ADP-forming] subunit beta, mitochondrial [Aphelenchoides besseyi]